jgi:hypothetical protein
MPIQPPKWLRFTWIKYSNFMACQQLCCRIKIKSSQNTFKTSPFQALYNHPPQYLEITLEVTDLGDSPRNATWSMQCFANIYIERVIVWSNLLMVSDQTIHFTLAIGCICVCSLRSRHCWPSAPTPSSLSSIFGRFAWSRRMVTYLIDSSYRRAPNCTRCSMCRNSRAGAARCACWTSSGRRHCPISPSPWTSSPSQECLTSSQAPGTNGDQVVGNACFLGDMG